MKKKVCHIVLIVLLILLILPMMSCSSEPTNLQHSLVQMDPEAVSKISSLISFVYEDQGNGLEDADFKDLVLGARIFVYVLENNEMVPSFSYLYPIYSANGLIGHISAYFVDDTTLSYGFKKQYVAAVASLPENSEYAVVYDCNGVYLLTDNGYYTVREYPYDETRTDIDGYLSAHPEYSTIISTAFRDDESVKIPSPVS